MQVVYDICTIIVKLKSKENEPIRLKNKDGDNHKNGTEILDWKASHDSSQLQQRIEALQVSCSLISLSLSLSLSLSPSLTAHIIISRAG